MIVGKIMLRKLDAGALAVLLMVLVEHLLLRNAVKKYYVSHLPHYDSIGSYTFAYEVLNAYTNEGWWAAIRLAPRFGLSLTQPMFAALFAPFLSPTPQSLLVYNSLCLGLLSWSLYALCRALGAGPFKGIAAAALPLVPDAFYWWNGGLQDWQRDPSYFCLLTSSFFLFFRHLIVRTKTSGALLGTAIALTILSRDSAPGYVLMILVPLFAVWLAALAWSGRLRENAVAFAVPALIATAGAGIYAIFTLQHTLARFGNVYTFYSWHSGFTTSLQAQWRAPVELLLGTTSGLGTRGQSNTALLVFGLFAALLLGAFGLWRLRTERLAQPEIRLMLLGGAWAFAFTMINLIGVVGIGSLHFQQVKPMFYPTLILFLAAGVALIVALDSPRGAVPGVAATCVLCAALILAIPARIAQKTFPHDPTHIAALPVLTKLATDQPNKVLAFLWHDGITPDTLAYYAAQGNLPRPAKLRFFSKDGHSIDMAIGVPARTDVPQMHQDLLYAMLCHADLIVVTTRLSWYERAEDPMFIFRHGRPVVERVMKELESRMIYEYSWHGVPLRVYDNRDRSRCDPARAPAVA